MRVAVTGATGLVGSRVAELLGGRFRFVPLDRSNGFDLGSPDARAWMDRLPAVDAVLHLGAKTQVDAIEAERALGDASEAMRVNRGSTEALCAAAKTRGVPLILVSTDFVFPAALEGPYREVAAPTRDATETSWYGWTKLLAERATLAHPKNAVLRISFPFRAHHPARTDHARRVLELQREGKLYPLFADQTFTPSFIDDVATSLGVLLENGLPGLFHCASMDVTTPYDFGRMILRATGLPSESVVRGEFASSVRPGRAPRPRRGGLDTVASTKRGMKNRTLHEMVPEFAAQWSAANHTRSARNTF
jgi:dTDP-4-dehydrorhamnose reductase